MTIAIQPLRLGIYCTAMGIGVLALSIVGARPASAEPTLFIGNVLLAGGANGQTIPAVTIPGPSGAAPVTATNTPGGAFTIPANAFSYSNPGYTFSLPPRYPYILKRIAQSNDMGNFAPGYWSGPTTKLVNSVSTMVFPYAPATARDATIRLLPGPNNFGGSMRVNKSQTQIFQIQASVFLYSGVAGAPLQPYTRGTGAFGWALNTPASIYGTKRVGHALVGLGPCCATMPISPTPIPTGLTASAFNLEFIGPWGTGMLYVNDNRGPDVTTTTQTGVDGRTAFDSGVISLVTPRLQHVYSADGTGTNTITSLRDAFSSIQVVEFSFLNKAAVDAPEPGTTSLLAGGGLLGLVGLQRMRRRRLQDGLAL